MSRIALLVTSIFLCSEAANASVEGFKDDLFTVKLFVEQPSLKLRFKPTEETAALNYVEYQPNTGTPSGVSLSVAGFFGFSYITEVNEEKVTADKGQTSYDDYRLTLSFDRFLISLNYLEYQGLFIQNSFEVDPNLPDDEPFIRRRDIKTDNIGANFAWIFAPQNYSLTAVLDQTRRQQQSGGSWVAGVNFNRFSFEADTPVIPSDVQDQFGTDATLIGGKFSTITVTAGYGYNWVFMQKFYIGGLLLAGTGYQLRAYESTANGEVEDSGLVEKIDLRVALGYNGDRYFAGVHSNGDITSFKTGSVKIESQLLNFQLFIGTRF